MTTSNLASVETSLVADLPVFYSHSTVRLKICKKNNNIAEKDCCPTMKFHNVLNDNPVDRILKFFQRA
jgi:hypothetical protein